MTRTEIEEAVLSVIRNPIVTQSPEAAAKMIAGLVFQMLGNSATEDRQVVTIDGRKMRLKNCSGPVVSFIDVNGSGAMIVGMIDSIVPRITGGRRALADALDALEGAK